MKTNKTVELIIALTVLAPLGVAAWMWNCRSPLNGWTKILLILQSKIQENSMKTKRSWTVEQKLSILKEAEESGVTATIRKHQIYGNTLYEWRQKYSTSGVEGLKTAYIRTSPEVRKLEAEIRMLKELVAEKELTIRIKDELLKKTLSRHKSGAR